MHFLNQTEAFQNNLRQKPLIPLPEGCSDTATHHICASGCNRDVAPHLILRRGFWAQSETRQTYLVELLF